MTVARALSNSFAGIAPAHVAAFIVAQVAGALLAVGLANALFAKEAGAEATATS